MPFFIDFDHFSPLFEALIWVCRHLTDWGPGDLKTLILHQNELKMMKIHHFLIKNGVFALRSGKTPKNDHFLGSKNRFFINFKKIPGYPPGNRKKRHFWSGKRPGKIVIFSEKLWKKGVSDPRSPSKPWFFTVLLANDWKCIVQPSSQRSSLALAMMGFVYVVVQWNGQQFERFEAAKRLKSHVCQPSS